MKGLPPRGRGRADVRGETVERVGITPAWAGKRRPHEPVGADAGDYPRVGGEEDTLRGKELEDMGLPPRGRGRDRFPL